MWFDILNGIVSYIKLAVASLFLLALGVFLVYEIGILPTAYIYVSGYLLYLVYDIYQHVKHRGGGTMRTVIQYDPNAADEAGSTARYGTPHDPLSVIPRWPSGRRPPAGE
jgi:hypothetical protein